MIPEGRIYNVKLCFLPKVAHNVSEVQWHSTQKTIRNNDGSVTVEFRVVRVRGDNLVDSRLWRPSPSHRTSVASEKSA